MEGLTLDNQGLIISEGIDKSQSCGLLQKQEILNQPENSMVQKDIDYNKIKEMIVH
jgi:hypothetical protein